MARQKKVEEVEVKQVKVTIAPQKKEQVQAPVIQQVKQAIQPQKLSIEQLLSMIHYAPSDYEQENNVIKIKLPILKSNFKCWRSVVAGSVYSYMQIDKNLNVVKIWDLTIAAPVSRIIKDSIIV